MSRFAILQAQSDAGPGHLRDWARDRGIELDIIELQRDSELPEPRDYDAAVALGCDASWAAARRPAWMERQLAWLRAAEQAELPVLGICFGAQALATLHGGKVTPLERLEVGWLQLEVDPQGPIAPGPWLSWHEDEITLPPGVSELARSSLAVHAFEVGHGLGIQFHPEAGVELVRGWVDSHGGRDLGAQIESSDELLTITTEHEEAARTRAFELFDRFARRIRR